MHSITMTKLEDQIKKECVLFEIRACQPDYVEGELAGCNPDVMSKLACGRQKNKLLDGISDIRKKYRYTKLNKMSDIPKLGSEFQDLVDSIDGANVPMQKLGAMTDMEHGLLQLEMKGPQNKTWYYDLNEVVERIDSDLFDEDAADAFIDKLMDEYGDEIEFKRAMMAKSKDEQLEFLADMLDTLGV